MGRLRSLLLFLCMAGWLAACTNAPTPILTSSPTATLLAPPQIATTPLPTPLPTPAGSVSLVTRLGSGAATVLDWAPDGSLLAVASTNGVYLFNGDSLTETQVIGSDSWVTAITFSRDGRYLALGQINGGVRVWDLLNNSFYRSLEGGSGTVSSLSFDSAGDQLAIGRLDSTMWIWRISDGFVRDRLRGHTDRVTAVDYGVQQMPATPGGSMLASASRDGTILVWNSGTGRSVALFDQHTGPVNALSFAPLPPGLAAEDERLASASDDGTIRFWAPQYNSQLLILNWFPIPGSEPQDASGMSNLAFTSDGGLLAGADRLGSILLWNAITGEPYRSFRASPESAIRSISFRPGTSFLAILSEDGLVRIWNANPAVDVDVTDPEALSVLDAFSGAVNDLAINNTQTLLASAHADGTVRLWDLETGAEIVSWREHTGAVTTVDFHPDGVRLVSGGQDGSLRIWDTGNANSPADPLLRILLGHRSLILQAKFSPGGDEIVSSSADSSLRQWSTATGSPLAAPQSGNEWIYSLAFSPDGNTLAAGDAGGDISFLRTDTLNTDEDLPSIQDAHLGAVLDIEFNPNSDLLGSAGDDTRAHLWEPGSTNPGKTLAGHTRRVTSLAFDPLDQFVATAAADGQVILWDLDRGQPIFSFNEPWPIVSIKITSLADGVIRLLVTGSSDGTLRFWRVNLP